MSYEKIIPETTVEIEFENLTIMKDGTIKTVYREDNKTKSKTINIFDEDISEDSIQKYLDVCFDNIKHQLGVDIKEFNFEKENKEEV